MAAANAQPSNDQESGPSSLPARPAVLYNDHTETFRKLVQSHDPSSSHSLRWQKSRDDALGPILSEETLLKLKAKAKRGEQLSSRERDALSLRIGDQEWIVEGVKLNKHIRSVDTFLRTIKRPYLSSSFDSAKKRPPSRDRDAGQSEKNLDAFGAWKGTERLTDKERDEIEFQVKVVIKRCLSRIKELQEGEEVRKRTTPLMSANPFSRLLGSATASNFPGRAHPLYAEQLTQHRSAITAYLSNELAHTSARLRDMQEARLRSRQARTINMAGSASSVDKRNLDRSATTSSTKNVVPGSVGSMSRASGSQMGIPPEDSSLQRKDDGDNVMAQLSPEQVQQFESESSALIKSLSEDLKAIEAAESKLQDISELQTQLIQHLGTQAETADHLHQEALGHALEVGKGNEQLKRAKESNRQASRFLSMFLVGSGLGLLFLHWMD